MVGEEIFFTFLNICLLRTFLLCHSEKKNSTDIKCAGWSGCNTLSLWIPSQWNRDTSLCLGHYFRADIAPGPQRMDRFYTRGRITIWRPADRGVTTFKTEKRGVPMEEGYGNGNKFYNWKKRANSPITKEWFTDQTNNNKAFRSKLLKDYLQDSYMKRRIKGKINVKKYMLIMQT